MLCHNIAGIFSKVKKEKGIIKQGERANLLKGWKMRDRNLTFADVVGKAKGAKALLCQAQRFLAMPGCGFLNHGQKCSMNKLLPQVLSLKEQSISQPMSSKLPLLLPVASHCLNHANDGRHSFHVQSKHDPHDGDAGSRHAPTESGWQLRAKLLKLSCLT